jgi:hypothetical protein
MKTKIPEQQKEQEITRRKECCTYVFESDSYNKQLAQGLWQMRQIRCPETSLQNFQKSEEFGHTPAAVPNLSSILLLHSGGHNIILDTLQRRKFLAAAIIKAQLSV